MKYKSRNQEPGIGELLKWNDPENEIWNYKTDNKHLIQDNPFDKVQKSINPSKNNWISESQDAYKGFFHINNDVYDVVDPNIALPFSCDSCKTGKRSTSSRRRNRRKRNKKYKGKNDDESYSQSSKSRSKSHSKSHSKHKHHKNHKHGKKFKKVSKETEERLKLFHSQSKWLPNSSMKTYYGKAPFDNYGRANTKSKLDGFLYGNYLKSFNVNPHQGENYPQYYQTYNNTLSYIDHKDELKPEPPKKVMEIYRLTDDQVMELNSRNPLFPQENHFESQGIKKPVLEKTRRFNPEYHDHKQRKKQLKAKKHKRSDSQDSYFEPEHSHGRSPSNTHSRSKSNRKHKRDKIHKKKNKRDRQVRIKEEEAAGFLHSKGINDPRDREYNVHEYLEEKKQNGKKFTGKITSTKNYQPDIWSMNKNELNPKYYTGKHAKDLNQVPWAGKKTVQNQNSNILYHDYE